MQSIKFLLQFENQSDLVNLNDLVLNYVLDWFGLKASQSKGSRVRLVRLFGWFCGEAARYKFYSA